MIDKHPNHYTDDELRQMSIEEMLEISNAWKRGYAPIITWSDIIRFESRWVMLNSSFYYTNHS